MGKREKILVSLMVAVLLYGIFELFFANQEQVQQTDPDQEVQEAQQLSQSLSQALQKAELSQAQEHILQTAAQDWTGDIFHEFPEEEIVETESLQKEEELGPLTYSGYLEMGGKRIAVINSVEYSEGDTLEHEKAVVQKITPNKVLVRSLDTGEERWVPYND